MGMNKDRFTFTIDASLSRKFKEICDERHLKYSGVLENFVRFFVNPSLYCFGCGNQFNVEGADVCTKCGWMVCTHCGICGCGLNEGVVEAIFHMRRTYEDLLMGRIK